MSKYAHIVIVSDEEDLETGVIKLELRHGRKPGWRDRALYLDTYFENDEGSKRVARWRIEQWATTNGYTIVPGYHRGEQGRLRDLFFANPSGANELPIPPSELF